MELSPRLYKRIVRPKWFTRQFLNNIIKKELYSDNKNILDFGCGVGSFSSMFEPANYMGIDKSPERVYYAKKQYPEYTFNILDGCHMPVPDQSIDYVLIISVLHHIPTTELPLYLREFQRILKHNGKVLVLEPCFLERSRLSNSFMRFFDKGDYIQYDTQYIRMFSSCNYRVTVKKKYKQLFFYNKILFSAVPIH